MNPYDSIRTNLEEAPLKQKYQERIYLLLKHAYIFRRFKIFVKIYICMYVFATFALPHQLFSCTIERHSGEIKFDTNKLFKKYFSHRSEYVGYKKITDAWGLST